MSQTTLTQRQANPKALAALLLLLTGMAQVWIVTAGWAGWPTYNDSYRLLTQGFLHGRLSLMVQPRPQLLALPDPYDPVRNATFRLHDAVLFDGKYYIYWGPVPALLAAAVDWPLGIKDPGFSDSQTTLLYMFGATAMGTILIFQIRRRWFAEMPVWTAAIPVISLGMCGPVLFTMARPAVYEAAIVAGQCFLLAGIVAAWFSLKTGRTELMVAAGILWTLAFGSRLSLAPAVCAIACITLWRLRHETRSLWPRALGLLIPMIAGVAMIAWYNHARFGSFGEFGFRYQLAAQNQHDTGPRGFTSPRYFLSNTLIYLFNPPFLNPYFPYILAEGWEPWATRLLSLPRLYHMEASVGLLWSAPFFFFAAVAPCVERGKKWAQSRDAAWLVLVLAAGAAIGILPALFVYGSTMRYLLDAVPCGMILAAMGYWAVLNRLPQAGWPRLAFNGFLWTMVIYQSVMGLALGMTGYYRHFANYNPGVFTILRDIFQKVTG